MNCCEWKTDRELVSYLPPQIDPGLFGMESRSNVRLHLRGYESRRLKRGGRPRLGRRDRSLQGPPLVRGGAPRDGRWLACRVLHRQLSLPFLRLAPQLLMLIHGRPTPPGVGSPTPTERASPRCAKPRWLLHSGCPEFAALRITSGALALSLSRRALERARQGRGQCRLCLARR